jgi:NTP pyrophosphatase (non-canonical NTP hydrolase)
VELNDYQARALLTDQAPAVEGAERIVPLLGLAGEVGELLAEYKKHVRDGEAHQLHPARVCEELGDILWYLAAVSERYGLSLEDVAESNLLKCSQNWSTGDQVVSSVSLRFDAQFPESERFPERFQVHFEEILEDGGARVRARWRGGQLGQTLTDNAHDDDGYRFHDVFHLGLVAGLGWSPVSRRNLGLKRRSVPATDEVEDGGRAIVIEEGITALAFTYAMEHDWLRDVNRVDHDWLRLAMKMTAHLEVSTCTLAEWEQTVLMACPIWKAIADGRGGSVEINLVDRRLSIVE